jgi:hypothetical protein
MCLHSIQARFARAPCTLAELVYCLPNVFPGHRLRDKAVESFRFAGRAERFAELVLHAGNILLAAGVAQL